jgi:phage replication-related protein YjqB (UPF0714/DUF867 family)
MRHGKYSSFVQLSGVEQEGRDYRRVVERRGSDVVILAPHGGEIEPGTSEVAKAVARDDLSLYCFEGLNGEHGRRLHITSVRFDEPVCVELIARAETAIAIHGCKGDEPAVYVGGLDESLIGELLAGFREAGIDAREDNSHHAGNATGNICNLGRSGMGVQLELTTGLRRAMFDGTKWWRRESTTEVFDRFVQVVRRVLLA